MRNRVTDFFLAVFIAGFYWLLSRTWRYRSVDLPSRQNRVPSIFAHWHGDELLLIGAYTHKKMAILSSRSRDGLLMARVMRILGFGVSRGSSSRGGGSGLKGLIDWVKKRGYDASLAVDGPRGPALRVKPGILKLAQKTGLPIVTGAGAASYRFVFRKAWNCCYIPLPFSRCVIVYGKPLYVPKEADEAQLEVLRRQLELGLFETRYRAESLVGREQSPDWPALLPAPAN